VARGTAIPYFDFSGGRNTQSAAYLLQENQAREDLNVHTSLIGDIEKRNGFQTFSGATLTGAPANATLVHSLYPANAGTKSLIAGVRTATTDSLVKITTGAVASNLKTGLTANKRWDWAQAEVSGASGPLFGMNGVDTPQRWDGAAASTSNWVATTGTVPPKGRFITFWMSRLWCLEGSRLWFSGITGSSPDPLNWDANNYVDLEPNDGQEGTGIGIYGPYLIVTKARKTYKVTDPVSGSYVKVSNEIGCVAPRSMVQTPIGLFMLSEDQGVCRTDGSKVEPISDDIRPDLVEVASHPETQEQAAGIMDGDRYYLSVSLAGTRNDHMLEYDLTARSWWLHDCASNQFALLDPGGTAVRYSADSTTTARVSKAFVENVFSDNGKVYAGGSYWTSPWRAWGQNGSGVNPLITKRINEIRVDGVGNWSAFIAKDFDDDFEAMEGEVWEAAEVEEEVIEETTFGGSGTFGGEGEFGGEGVAPPANAAVERRYLTPALGRAFSVKFTDNSEDSFAIRSKTFHVTSRSD
jgi:hypothetical protein